MCGVYRTYGTGNNGICNISSNSNSNSNSNAEVPMPWFTNGFKQVPQHRRDILAQKTKKRWNVVLVKQVQQHPRNRLTQNKTKEEQIMHEIIGLLKANNEFFIENKPGANAFMLKKEN